MFGPFHIFVSSGIIETAFYRQLIDCLIIQEAKARVIFPVFYVFEMSGRCISVTEAREQFQHRLRIFDPMLNVAYNKEATYTLYMVVPTLFSNEHRKETINSNFYAQNPTMAGQRTINISSSMGKIT
jgi:hypothetical protein